MRAGRHQRAADGQTPVPLRLSRSVIDSVGPAGAEFARNADHYSLMRARVIQLATRRLSDSVKSQFICDRCQVSSDSWSWSENASVGRRSGPRWMAPSASRTSSLRAPEAV